MMRCMNRTIFHACTHMFCAVLVGCLFLVTSGEAASFDCSQARAQIEKLICGDQQVSKMDEDLAASYADLLTKAADPKALRTQQREWLINLRKHCNNIVCLRNAYAVRLKVEADLLAKLNRADLKTCQLVTDYANRGDLHSISLQPTIPRPEPEKLVSLMGKGLDLPENLSYWSVDLDHDGTPEHFITVVDYEQGDGYALARSTKKDSTVIGVNDNEDKNIYLSVLSVNGRYYILSSTPPRLGKLWRLARNGEFVNMCKFSQREEPIIERTDGKENPVCRDANDNRIPPVAFSNMHALSAVTQEPFSGWSNLSDNLARVDINNDGLVDNVVRFTTSGSHGCDTQYFATTDMTRTHIPGTALNDLLHRGLGTDRCSRNLEIFVHRGVTYVGIQSSTSEHTVYRIKGNLADNVCEFPGRVINEVLDADQEAAK